MTTKSEQDTQVTGTSKRNAKKPARTVESNPVKRERNLKNELQNMAKDYRNQEYVDVTISPTYAPYFGKVMVVELNGIKVSVACNGRTQKIPKSFAMEVRSRIFAVDQKIMRRQRMNNVKNNIENYPGQLDLIQK